MTHSAGARSVAEHQKVVATLLPEMPVVELPLAECGGLALGADVHTALPLPPFDNSAMDGYAVRAGDVAGAPVTLPVPEDLPAGRTDSPPLSAGSAYRIMTGAPVPPGADTVVPVERTDGARHRVRIDTPARVGDNIRRAGEDVTAGSVVLDAGQVLGPAQLSVAAAVGLAGLPVYRPVRVLVLSTGSELVEPGRALAHGQIYESNGVLLAAAVREAGGHAEQLHFVPDDAGALDAALAPRLENTDLLVTSGGVSAGAYEVVKDAMAGRGVEFGKVAMHPGSPQGAGHYRGVPVVALPGNPVSSSVSFEVFVRPALRAAMRLPARRPRFSAQLTDGIDSPSGRRQFRRGTLDPEESTVTPVGGPGSHLLAALARSDCLIEIDEHTTRYEAADAVTVIATTVGCPWPLTTPRH